MSEHKDMLADAVTRLFRDAGSAAEAAEAEGWQQGLWQQVEDLGLPLLLLAEDDGGVGGDWEDLLAVLQPAGETCIPLPIGEAMIATRLAADAGLPLPEGVATVCADTEGGIDKDGRFSGRLRGVPWGRDANIVMAVLGRGDEARVLRLKVADATVEQAANLASEPRDTLYFDAAPVEVGAATTALALRLRDHCALMRTAQAIGALESALQRSIDYAGERRQFGRSIGKFQAVQQQLALFGADTAAATCAAQAACRAVARARPGAHSGFQIAAAKLRANQAIGLATATAHQVHAAIGFTREYALRHATQRLWSWRSEYGNDRYWSARLGTEVAARGAAHFWQDLTARDDAAAL